jgi:hypothetical protein
MKLGNSIADRRMQKKQLASQVDEREKDRQLTRDQGSANRALAKRRMRKEMKQKAKLSAAGITSAEKIAGEANTLREKIAGDASTERLAAAKAAEELGKKQLENQAEGLALQKARNDEASKTDMERLQDTLMENESRKVELTEARKSMAISPEEIQAIDTELRVINTMDAISAKSMDMALAKGDATMLAQHMSMVIDKKPTGIGTYRNVPGVYGSMGEKLESPYSFNTTDGTRKEFGEKPPAGGGGGGGGTSTGTNGLDPDSTIPSSSFGQEYVDNALRPLGGSVPPPSPTAGIPSVNGAGGGRFGGGTSGSGGASASGGSPLTPAINLNLNTPSPLPPNPLTGF